jgi:hypothetical protein
VEQSSEGAPPRLRALLNASEQMTEADISEAGKMVRHERKSKEEPAVVRDFAHF